MINTYKELLRKNQLELEKLEERNPETIFTHTIPIYQNPETRRPSVDPYEILQIYRLPNGQYKKVLLVHFDKLPKELRGFTDCDREIGINENDYEPYFVMGHEATHIRHPEWSEYMVRAYSPRDVRTLEALRVRFSEFDFIIM